MWRATNGQAVAAQQPAVTGHGLRGAVVEWYLPVLVVDEDQMKSGGVRVMALMEEVAISV